LIYKRNNEYKNDDMESETPLPVTSGFLGEDLAPEKSNDIYLYDDITTDSLLKTRKKISKQILNYKKILIENNLDLNMLNNFHINLHINSNGGYVLDSFGMYDFIRSSVVPIHTYVEGVAASAATIVSVAGHKRFMSRSSLFMIHQLKAWFGGKHEEIIDEKLNLDLMMKRIKKIYLETTKMSKTKLNTLLKRDLFLEVDKCIEYGFIDVGV
jgi:ATP-dependent protease ClpP protease subunit